MRDPLGQGGGRRIANGDGSERLLLLLLLGCWAGASTAPQCLKHSCLLQACAVGGKLPLQQQQQQQ
jgi:uncharacterized membrane protein YsdA (DUF1294 family)